MLHSSCALDKDIHGLSSLNRLTERLHNLWKSWPKNIMSLLLHQFFRDKKIKTLFIILPFILIIMETLLELSRRVIFQELEILINPLTIWKAKVVIRSMILNLEELEVIFVMEDIIHFIGWDLDSMELKLLWIHQQL